MERRRRSRACGVDREDPAAEQIFEPRRPARAPAWARSEARLEAARALAEAELGVARRAPWAATAPTELQPGLRYAPRATSRASRGRRAGAPARARNPSGRMVFPLRPEDSSAGRVSSPATVRHDGARRSRRTAIRSAGPTAARGRRGESDASRQAEKPRGGCPSERPEVGDVQSASALRTTLMPTAIFPRVCPHAPTMSHA